MEEKVWDPLRRKEVPLTPEERVRQWFISFLRSEAGVPVHMMMSEVALLSGGKRYRADIVVYDRTGSPLMVVECKKPEVPLDEKVTDQALRYDRSLGVRYIAVTNGHATLLFEKTEAGFSPLLKLPSWEEMLCRP